MVFLRFGDRRGGAGENLRGLEREEVRVGTLSWKFEMDILLGLSPEDETEKLPI